MVGPFTKQARRDFLRASGQLATGVTVGASTATAASKAVREPAVIGYPNRKGLTIERVS